VLAEYKANVTGDNKNQRGPTRGRGGGWLGTYIHGSRYNSPVGIHGSSRELILGIGRIGIRLLLLLLLVVVLPI
jgi:hypothetical protein